MENQRIENMLKLLILVISGDPAIYSHPAAQPESIQKIFDQYLIPKCQVKGDPIADLLLGLRTVLANIFIDTFTLQKKSTPAFLRGFVVLYWKYFASTNISKMPDILRACQEPDALEAFDTFLVELPWVKEFSHPDLAQWFEEKFDKVPDTPDASDLARRTLSKQEKVALDKWSLALYQIIPSAFIDPGPENGSSTIETIAVDQVMKLIGKLMLRGCAIASPALGISVPITGPIDRNVQVGASEILHTAVDNLIPLLCKSSGLISSRPFSGLSTFLRSLAATVDDASAYSVCYIEAVPFYRYVQARRSVYLYLTDQMQASGLIESDMRATIETQIEELDRLGKLIFFLDEMQSLMEEKALELIQHLSFSPHVYYAARTSAIALIEKELKKYNSAPLSLRLLDLDFQQQDAILLKILQGLNRADEHAGMVEKLLELRRDPGGHDMLTSPLGILALVTQTGSPTTMRTRIIISMLNEMLRREGLGEFTLFPRQLDQVSDNLMLFGGWVRSFIGTQRLKNVERMHLAWRLNQEYFEIFEQNDYLKLLNSALFLQETYLDEYGLDRSYWFEFRDLALFFAAASWYLSQRSRYDDPYHNLWYVNGGDALVENEINRFLADLKEYLLEKN